VAKEFFSFVVGTGNHVDGNQFANTARSCRTRFGSSFHRSDIPSHQHGDIAIKKVFAAHQHHVCGLHHRIGSLDCAHQPERFNHAEGFHVREPTRIDTQKQLTPGKAVPYDSATYMSNFGASFKRARESSGLPLEKIAAETRISTRFLVAIENEDFHLLPGGVFNRGFIRSYAERVGLNPDQALADYDRISTAVEEPVEVLRNVERASMKKSERSLYPIAGGLLALLIIVFYVVTRNGSAGSVAEPVTPVPQAAPAVAPVPADPVAAAAPEPAITPVPAPAVETPPLVLDLDVKDVSWIKITTDGTVALSDNLQAGSKQHFTAKSSIDLVLGNAGGANFTINGRELGMLGKSGEVRQLTITPENAATIK